MEAGLFVKGKGFREGLTPIASPGLRSSALDDVGRLGVVSPRPYSPTTGEMNSC